jgi:hypothetical protein
MTPLVRNPITRARLEGLVLGMCIAMLLLWCAQPIVTGRWSLL